MGVIIIYSILIFGIVINHKSMKLLLVTLLFIPVSLIFSQEIDYSIAANYEYKYISNSYQLKDTTVKVVWRTETYDAKTNQTISSLVINEGYMNIITDPERAALGYVASLTGNECQWDGGSPNAVQDNVTCKVLSSLKLGYMCSAQNLEFFRKWFTESSDVLRDIENCKPILFTASEQTTIDKIVLTTLSDRIKIKFTAYSVNLKKQKFEQWSEELTFSLSNNRLALILRDRKVKK
jgi:hypothetical protein